MKKRLYVGNLPFSVTEDKLKEMFEAGGWEIASVRLITDRNTGRSRGFGFVEFVNDDDARAAIEANNGKEIDGRALVVNEARERESREGGGGGGGGGGNRRGGRGGGGGGGGRGRY